MCPVGPSARSAEGRPPACRLRAGPTPGPRGRTSPTAGRRPGIRLFQATNPALGGRHARRPDRPLPAFAGSGQSSAIFAGPAPEPGKPVAFGPAPSGARRGPGPASPERPCRHNPALASDRRRVRQPTRPSASVSPTASSAPTASTGAGPGHSRHRVFAPLTARGPAHLARPVSETASTAPGAVGWAHRARRPAPRPSGQGRTPGRAGRDVGGGGKSPAGRGSRTPRRPSTPHPEEGPAGARAPWGMPFGCVLFLQGRPQGPHASPGCRRATGCRQGDLRGNEGSPEGQPPTSGLQGRCSLRSGDRPRRVAATRRSGSGRPLDGRPTGAEIM